MLATYGMLNGTFSSVSGVPAGYSLNYDLDGLKQIALVQTGADPYSNWASLNGILINVVNDGFGADIDRVTVRIPRALAAPGNKLFARLRVNIP